MPAGLRAIARLAAAGLLSSDLGQQAAAQAAVWEERAAAFFRVELTAEQVGGVQVPLTAVSDASCLVGQDHAAAGYELAGQAHWVEHAVHKAWKDV